MLELTLPLLVMVIGTSLFFWSDLDLEISNRFFDQVNQRWWGNDRLLVKLSYTFGPYISAAFTIWALVIFFLSFMKPRFIVKRAVTAFILLCVIIGPVVVVNGVFKETWRRPRPRDTLELGGHHPFQKVLVITDRSFRGKSFPSGHASSGYVLFFLYFLLKRKRPRLAGATLLFALFWGTWLGFVRIILGGHYASDVLWAFGLVWYVTYWLFYHWLPRYERKLAQHQGFHPSCKRYVVAGSLVLIFIAVTLFRFLSSTPFRVDYPVEKLKLPHSVRQLHVRIRAKKGDIAVYYGKPGEILIRTWINGHGRPGIQAVRKLKLDKQKMVWRIDYQVKPSGYYYEYQSHNSIKIPKGLLVEFDLETKLGSVFRNDLNPRAGGK